MIFVSLLLMISIYCANGEYELLARQKTLSNYFAGSIVTTGVENADNPDANTYSIIGNIEDPAKYQDSDGYYNFKLEYVTTGGDPQTLIWKQKSWLSETATIEGFEAISLPARGDRHGTGADFHGLGHSTDGRCYLDGHVEHNYWFNCVGSTAAWNNGIPCYDGLACKSMAFYIEDGGACDLLDIDNYLTHCSDKFTDSESTIDGLRTDTDANTAAAATNAGDIDTNKDSIGTNADDIDTNEGNIATNAGDIETNEGSIGDNSDAISGLDTRIGELETKLAAAEQKLEELGDFPEAQSVFSVPSSNNNNSLIDTFGANNVLLLSLVLNIILLCSACLIFTITNKNNKQKYSQVGSVDTDSENQTLN